MKSSLLTIIIGCFLLAGCQSANSLSSKLTSGLFAPSKTKHTLSSNSPNPSSPSAMQLSSDDFRQGEEALKKGDLKKAKRSFLAVVKQQPNNAAAHHRLGYIADKMEDFTMSRIHYITAMKLEPNNPDIACDLGYSYLLQNQLEESQRYLEKALTINPAHQSSLLNMASLLGKRGNYEGALAIFRQAGSEQEAQKNIAQLFPNGRPADQAMASGNNQPNQVTQDLQQQMAALANKQRLEMKLRKKKRDLAQEKLAPREVPAGDINDIFAKIDREFDQKQQGSPLANPGNRGTIPPQSLPAAQPNRNDLIARNPQQYKPPAGYKPPTGPPVLPASSRSSSVPGEIPTQSIPGSLEDYAILRSEQNVTPSANSQMMPRNYPMNPNSPLLPETQNNLAGQTNQNYPQSVSESSSPAFNQLPAQKQSQQKQSQQKQSPQLSLNNQIPNNQVPNSQPIQSPATAAPTDAASYQQAVTLAMQMGMNAGPGQMFPLNTKQPSARWQAYPSGRNYSPEPSRTNPAFSKQPAPPVKKKHQHPFQHLPIQPPTTTPTPNSPPVAHHGDHQHPTENKPLFLTSQTPVPAMTSTQASTEPAQRGGEIQNWPHAPNSQVQQASHENYPNSTGNVHQAKSETPWLNQQGNQNNANRQPKGSRPFGVDRQNLRNGKPGNQNQLPLMQPSIKGQNSPGQWPYSPQAGNPSPQNNGPVIHRRAQYPTSGSYRSGSTNSSMPQVVPGAR